VVHYFRSPFNWLFQWIATGADWDADSNAGSSADDLPK